MGVQEKLKVKAINKIEEDIQHLSAGDLEIAGHALLQLLENQQLHHRGLNRNRRPVGYTIDSFSNDRICVGEYSAEKDYFKGPFNKLCADVKHALDEAPQVQRLYLMSSQTCPNKEWGGVSNNVKDIINNDEIKFTILDSRGIAENLYQQLIEKTDQIKWFEDLIPTTSTLLSDYIIEHKIPSLPSDYFPDNATIKKIKNHFDSNDILVIYGISGSGKTWASLDLLHNNIFGFDNIIWLIGKDIPVENQFSSVQISRLGHTLNLEAQFNRGKCLLAIDSLEEKIHRSKFDSLKLGLENGSKILITSQCKPAHDIKAFSFPSLSEDVADKILTNNCDVKPTQLQKDSILNKSGRHPLVLSIVREGVCNEDYSWEEIAKEIGDIPELEDNSQQTILKRIIGRHAAVIDKELRKLTWLNKTIFDSRFLKHYLGSVGLSKLRDRSLLESQGIGFYRIHDLVYLCIDSIYDRHNVIEYKDDFIGAVTQEYNSNSFHFRRAIHMHNDILWSLINKENMHPSPEMLFYLLSEQNPSIEMLEHLTKISFITVKEEELPCIIEAFEKLFHTAKTREAKESTDKKFIEEIDSVLSDYQLLSDETKSLLFHHKGKILRRQKENSNAVSCFKQAIELSSGLSAFNTKLQLARMYGWYMKSDQDKIHKGEGYIREIIDSFCNDPDEADITVCLATIHLLSSYRSLNKEIFENEYYIDAIKMMITQSLVQGFHQPYEAFVVYARALNFTYPEEVLEIAEAISFPSISSTDIGYHDLFNIADAHKYVGKAYLYNNQMNKSKIWLQQSLPYYEKGMSLSRNVASDSFKIQSISEALNLLEMYNEAMQWILKIPIDKQDAFLERQYAISLNGIRKPTEALPAIEHSLLECPEEYLSAFYDTKADILLNLCQTDKAIKALDLAIEHTDSEKYRNKLLSKKSTVL